MTQLMLPVADGAEDPATGSAAGGLGACLAPAGRGGGEGLQRVVRSAPSSGVRA